MHNADYTSSSPYYHPQQYYPQSPNPNSNPNQTPIQNPNQIPIEPNYHAPPSYASAPPFSPNNYAPPPPPPPHPSSADYNYNSTPYPSFPQTPESTTSYSQPQSAYSFPQFEAHGPYQHPARTQLPSYHDPPAPPAHNYNSNPNPNPNPVSPNYPSIHPSTYSYEAPYDSHDVNFGRSRSDLGSELYGKRSDIGGYGNDGGLYGSDEGVYAYKGSSEPYGARGTAPKSSTWSGFDDFGRPIGYSSPGLGKERSSSGSGGKVVKAVPKAETQQDAKGGVQKFRVKLLAESGGQSTMDVLCQIGLDGIRMLDPSTSRILRIYLLDTITKCEAIDSSIFAFWSKSSVDIEARRIRLQSNRYTTNTILDTVTAATVQFKEMSERSRPEYPKIAEQPTEKKKGFADFVNLMKPVNEEKEHWVPDEAVSKCTGCGTDFSAFVRKHHCRNCGDIFCDKCTHGRTALTADENAPVVRVCDRCLAEVSRRLSKAKEAASRPTVQSHEDLAKKLQEEMERSCKVSGSKSESSGRRMKEVACPTCTVHLQVEVPSSGSETIECGVCQHPFLVTGH